MLELIAQNWEDLWGDAARHESVGAVFTRPEVVRLILDLAGYAPDAGRLAERRVLEPSCGDGAFLSEVIARLLASEHRAGREAVDWGNRYLDNALRAADIDASALARARAAICDQLTAAGCPTPRAEELVGSWLVRTDFLLHDWREPFDLVVGNPPYVRIEDLPRPLLQRYRAEFRSMTDRADLYIAFLERGLQLLSADGVLAVICANRFAKNAYGAALRSLIAQRYHVHTYLNLEHTQPFLSEVSAYPAILVADRRQGVPTRAGTLSDLEEATLAAVRRDAHTGSAEVLAEFAEWYPRGAPWVSTSRAERQRLAELERHPLLEQSAGGTRVGIGVATGADRVFILTERDPTIEDTRQIPLVMARDLSNQGVSWSGAYLVNPFADDESGALVDLASWPGLAAYLEPHGERLRNRHVARTRPQAWYRTIDRIWPALRTRPKLLIPDIQGSEATIGLDEGRYYPHHNLYWITSEEWDLRALKALLRSRFVRRQVEAHSVQMRGGSLRYQAQTLRRVRVPAFASLPASLVVQLRAVAESTDQAAIDEVAAGAFARR